MCISKAKSIFTTWTLIPDRLNHSGLHPLPSCLGTQHPIFFCHFFSWRSRLFFRTDVALSTKTKMLDLMFRPDMRRTVLAGPRRWVFFFARSVICTTDSSKQASGTGAPLTASGEFHSERFCFPKSHTFPLARALNRKLLSCTCVVSSLTGNYLGHSITATLPRAIFGRN